MAQLVAAKCPTCGAGLRLDPAVEFALCQYCSTSSFVRTKTRSAPPHVVRQRSPVIDVGRSSYGWLIALAVVVIVGGSIPLAVSLFRMARSVAIAHLAPPKAVPTSVPSLVTTNVEPVQAAPVRDDSVPANVVSDGSLAAPKPSSAERKPSSSSSPSAKSPRARVSTGQITVSGRLAPDVVRRVVGGNTSRFRMCYEQGLGRSSTLSGRVAVRFVIGRDGSVSNVSDAGSDLADAAAKGCVISAFYGLSFPPPEGGIVTVAYPLVFRAEQ
jgi:hypothetical protein